MWKIDMTNIPAKIKHNVNMISIILSFIVIVIIIITIIIRYVWNKWLNT